MVTSGSNLCIVFIRDVYIYLLGVGGICIKALSPFLYIVVLDMKRPPLSIPIVGINSRLAWLYPNIFYKYTVF